jgi:hypothetical protein
MAINKDFLVKNGLQVGGNTQLTGSLTAAGLSYPVSDGDQYMAMVTDGNGNLSFNNVDTVESDVTNNTGSLIPKGTPVYQTGAAGNTLTIAPSDASNAATMPAIGVTGSDIANGDTGRVIHFGYIKGVDTSAFSEGDRIYVADGGGYQEGRPTGEGNVVQFLGVVTKVHATNGSGVVFGGGRAHAVPNLDDGNIFIGDNTNSPVTATLDTSIVPENSNLYFTDTRAVDAVEAHPHLTIDGGTLYVDTDANRIGINDTSPSQALDVTGNIAVAGTTVIDSGAEIVTAQLKDSGVTAGSYGSASLVPIITVDAKGRITSASTTSVAGVSNFTFNNTTDVLTISTADGGSFPVDISNITVGGSMVGPLADLTVVYQSAAPSDPSQGQMWFDSLNQLMMVYTGSAWVQAVPGGGTSGGGDTTDAVATMEKYTYSISSTTNSVQGTDDNGNSLAYVVDGSQNVEVFVNGVKQAEGAAKDYVATTGTAVTFTYNLPAGTIVDVQVFELLTQDAFYLKSETYNRTETNSQISTALGDYLQLAGGTLTGNLSGTNATFTGDLTVDTNTLFVDSTDNRVGIGTTSPAFPLDIYDTRTTGTNVDLFRIYTASGGGFAIGQQDLSNGNPVHHIRTYANESIAISEGYDEYVRFDGANGRVGIGTDSPTRKLHILGNGTYSGGMTISNSAGNAEFYLSDNTSSAFLAINRSDTGSEDIKIHNGGNVVLADGTGGLVGIGVNNPLAALHIQHSTKPQLLLDGGSDTTGDIVVPDSEKLQIGHWNSGTSTYTPRITVSAAGNTNIGTGRSGPGESTAQGLSPEAGRGVLSAPWVATSCIEAVTEMGAGSVGISLGQNGMTGGGQANLQDEVAIWCDGGHVLEVRGTHANNTLASVVVYGESYTTVTGSSSTNPNSGAMNFRVTGDSDGLAIYNVSAGDYSLCNTQQGNGIIFYDGSGGMRGYYNNTQMYEVNAAGFSTSSDIRLKENIGALDIDATNIVNNLDLIAYHPKSSQNDVQGDQNETIYGFSAQELYALDNNLVSKGADDLDNDVDKLGVYSVKTTSMHALLLKALQEANAKIADLEARIEALEAK